MDFENKGAQEIQKINDLAFSLQKQAGMSREESLQQAEKMVSKSYKFEVNELSPQKLKEMEAPKVERPNVKIDWQEAMSKNNEFIVKSFKEMKNEIASLKSELDLLKNQMRNTSFSSKPSEPAKPQKTLVKEEKNNSDHPRHGQFDNNAYAVEKMFYCGNKKQ